MGSLREVVDQLNCRWHGRSQQIRALIEQLSPDICGRKSLHVYGPAGTGKTGLLRYDSFTLRKRERFDAIAACVQECRSQRGVDRKRSEYAATPVGHNDAPNPIRSQSRRAFHSRRKGQNVIAVFGCCSDTLQSLGFCVAQIGSLEVDCSHAQLWPYIVNSWRTEIGEPEKKVPDDEEAQLGIAECRRRTDRPLCVLVDPIDSHVDAEWVSAVLELWRRCSTPFTVIMVSLVPWLSVFGNSCPPEPRPHPVHFRMYSQEQIEIILRKQRPEFVPEQLYITILRSFVRPQYHASALLTDAQTLVADLIEDAMQAGAPLTDTDAVMAHLQGARKRIAAGGFFEDFPGLSADVCTSVHDASAAVVNASSDASLELPRLTKLLVLAAHVASNNKPSADCKLFSNAPSQKRRKDAMASDRQAMAAQKQMDSEGQVALPMHNPPPPV